jgi:HlyD family secretion protein
MALFLAGWLLLQGRNTVATERYRIARVTRQDIRMTIDATGTLEPEDVVDVGAQVAGQILAFGYDRDHSIVDYGSRVDTGTVLARIDDTFYAADVAQNKAQVQVAEASLDWAKAEAFQTKTALVLAQRDWDRAQKLGPGPTMSQADYDVYQANYENILAGMVMARASVSQAEAGLTRARAALERAQRYLDYCTITSPIRGVIIDRRVNIGQTVVSNLNAPSLFLIARDLGRMQIWVAVNEADIGKIRVEQPVSFTVDAFPEERFSGIVEKIRLNAAMSQNVVTYTVEIQIENPDKRLMPYLTANIQFEVDRQEDTLCVPNSALNWQPETEQIDPAFRHTGRGEKTSGYPVRKAISQEKAFLKKQHWLWIPAGTYVAPIRVEAGISDGVLTSVTGKGLKDGMAVVTGCGYVRYR